MTEAARAAVTFDVGEGLWRLEHGYFYENGPIGIAMPEGFLFDLASIPRLGWWLIAPFELTIEAALIHDGLYRTGGCPAWVRVGAPARFTRREADLILLSMMRRDGVPEWKCRSAFRAVRLFGGAAWAGAGAS